MKEVKELNNAIEKFKIELCKSLYIDKFCNWLGKKIENKKTRNKIILGIILIAMMFVLTGCSSESVAETELKNRLVVIYEQGYYKILVDTRTNVEYLQYRQEGGFRIGGCGGLTMLCNQDGTPLLYGGE